MGKSNRRSKARGHTRVTRALFGDHETELQRAARLEQEAASTTDPVLAEMRQLEADHLRSRQRRWEQGRHEHE